MQHRSSLCLKPVCLKSTLDSDEAQVGRYKQLLLKQRVAWTIERFPLKHAVFCLGRLMCTVLTLCSSYCSYSSSLDGSPFGIVRTS